jgi:xanthine dehydrogenase molybdopterin-binding subunit B
MHAPAPKPIASAIEGGVGAARGHDSGAKHVAGEAVYVDDIPEPPGTLHITIAMSERAHAVVKSLDVSKVRMALWSKGRNAAETIYRSKAVGEPPLMLGISVLMALSDAVASVGGYRIYPALDAPATPERILTAMERVRRSAGAAGAQAE